VIASLGIVIVLAASGCASVVSKTNWPVYVQAVEGETDFVIKNAYGLPVKTGKTPTPVMLPSGRGWFQKADYTVTFNKPGYQPLTVDLRAYLNNWYLGNIISFSVIGFFIADPATGAMWTLPDSVSVSLADQAAYDAKSFVQRVNAVPQPEVFSLPVEAPVQ
jgi:hypothetical protein